MHDLDNEAINELAPYPRRITYPQRGSKRRHGRGLVMLIFLVLLAPAVALGAELDTFTTQQAAQHHCPADTVVWLNLPTGIYHFQGERWYGRTNHGAFVCKTEADQFGDRATRNGQ
jgi:hypothetical protein